MKNLSWLITSSCLVAMLLVVPGAAIATGYFGMDYDFDGRTVTICNFGTPGIPGRFLEGGVAQGRLEEAEQLFNVEIDFNTVHYTELADNYLTRLMSGDSDYDVWFVQNRLAYYQLASQGGLLPIDEVVDEDFWERLSYRDQFTAEATEYRGTKFIFNVSVDYDDQLLPPLERSIQVFFYNIEMFEREGLSDPYQLYLEGKWDWETAGDLARQLTKDTNGDGQVDQWGLSSITDWSIYPFMLSNEAEAVVLDEDDRYIYNVNTKEAEAALRQLSEWYSEGLMRGNRNEFMQGSLGMLQDYLQRAPSINENMVEPYGIVPIPKGPDVDDFIPSVHAVSGWVIPINSSEPEALMALVEFLYRDNDDARIESFNMELSQWKTRENAEVALALSQLWSGHIYGDKVEITDSTLEAASRLCLDDIVKGRRTFGESVNQSLPVIQGFIDDLYN